MASQSTRPEGKGDAPVSKYVPPTIRVMDEAEVLKAFQITSAGQTWWVM